jgi:hypothetical protein
MKEIIIAVIILSLCIGCAPPTFEPWPTSIIRDLLTRHRQEHGT